MRMHYCWLLNGKNSVCLLVIKKLMATPLILDGRNIYDKAELEEAGFIYHCIGR